MMVKTLKRNIFQRILGISATKKPVDDGCWSVEAGKLIIDLDRARELSSTGSGIRLEGEGLSKRVLVIHSDDGEYRAFHNCCGHAGRRLDPVPATETVQCCSVSKSTFDYEGKIVSGMAKKPVMVFTVTKENGQLIVTLE